MMAPGNFSWPLRLWDEAVDSMLEAIPEGWTAALVDHH
jgi:hypothetical protein